MRKILRQIQDGNFTSEEYALEFSCSRIELHVNADCDLEGSFHIYGPLGVSTEGTVRCTDCRMECLNDRITGSDTEISYHFHSESCTAGDVVKGSFIIVSNLGEYFIPFTVSVDPAVPDSTIGSIRNLFHFANLAKTSWTEARDLFYSSSFERILTGTDETYRDEYRALSADYGNEQNLEEFLIHINKKQRIEYILKTQRISVNFTGTGGTLQEKEIEILRNGWGYTYLDVICEGDFFFTEKSVLTDSDFSGNVSILGIFFDTEKCRVGRHFGRLILKNSFTQMEIQIQVDSTTAEKQKVISRNYRQLYAQITLAYVDMRMGKISKEEWESITAPLIEQMSETEEDGMMSTLFKGHLNLIDGRLNEAGWLLDRAADLLERKMQQLGSDAPELDLPYCYHAYLTTLIRTEEAYVREIAQQTQRIYKRNRSDWRFAWLMLYLNGNGLDNSQEAWSFLEKSYEAGCRSSIIYMEAFKLLAANPALARKLEGFTLQVIHFGSKNHLVDASLLDHILYLCGKSRQVDGLLLHSLEHLYDYLPEQLLLQEICTQLIRQGRKDEAALVYYEKAVTEQIRLTNLYEIYVQSLDLSKQTEIPEIVLRYFTFQNNLDYERMAYLYHYMIRHRRSMENVLASNLDNMRLFALEQIQKGRINRNLAAVYDEVLTPEMLDRQLADSFCDLLYSNWIDTRNPKFVAAYVYQNGFSKCWRYPLTNGAGVVSVYGRDYTICFEDMQGNRYLKRDGYTMEKLMLPGRYIRTVANYVWDNERFNYFLCFIEKGEAIVSEENVMRFLQLCESEDLDEEQRNICLLKALRFYSGLEEHQKEAARLMRMLKPLSLTATQRADAFHFLVTNRLDRVAFDWLERLGPYFASVKDLERLAERLLKQDNPETIEFTRDNEIFDATAEWLLHNHRVSTPIIEYLANRYEGLSKSLRDIWKLARSQNLDRGKLCERILIQILYTGAFVGERMSILEDYLSYDADTEVVKAFLDYNSHDFFVGEQLVDKSVFEHVHELYTNGESIQRISKLAFLKYYAENGTELPENFYPTLLDFLEEMMAEHIHQSFYPVFAKPGFLPEGRFRDRACGILEELRNVTVVDYHTSGGCAVKIHYSKPESSEGYVDEYMREAFRGVYFSEFTLFFGETIQYYITEEGDDGSKTTTVSDTLSMNDMAVNSHSDRYDYINDMLISMSLGDYDTLDSLFENYYHREYLTDHLFELQ